ncbi:acetyl-CoA hydrolase/transferase C-terminal domain-containing protein [Tistrella mobilis]|uniref:acetyl-CoA hydrolase/transferase family protein n=1 Tax=Tistrella mobilis TaxID=171437 RepID=UPI0035579CD2
MVRVIAPEALILADHIRPGETLCWGQAAAEPLTLTEALSAQRHDLGGVKAFTGIGWGRITDPAHADAIRFTSYCGTGRNRLLRDAGALDILPVHYSAFEPALARRVDVLLLQLAPGRRPGSYSFGLACEYLWPLVASARLVIAEVNDQVPSTPASVTINEDDIDILVPTSRPVPEPPRAIADPTQTRIAAHVAGLIPDGAVLQVGLGALPAAILDCLDGHRNLGVHSGLFVDGFTRLIEKGVIDNSRKILAPGISVAGLIAGTAITHRLCHRSDVVRLAPTSQTHALSILAGIKGFTAINSALEVDLTGQVNAEEIDGRYVGAVGGGTDFARGAAAAKSGLPIIALPSARRGRDGSLVSSIVPALNGPVSLARADAGVIVTEEGVADLRGASLSERVERLIAISHPELRETLTAHARQQYLL